MEYINYYHSLYILISVCISNLSWHSMLETSEGGVKARTRRQLGMGEQASTHRFDSTKLPYSTMRCFTGVFIFARIFYFSLSFFLVFFIPTCWYQKREENVYLEN